MTGRPEVPISALEHHAYCPRQCALIHVDGVWMENAHTVLGRHRHHRVDSAPSRSERGRLVLRGVRLYSEGYGLTGRADAVELLHDGAIIPVEYKGGVRHGDAADIQLCAQALCLEEMTGAEITRGYVWYMSPRRRMRVEFDVALRETTVRTIQAVRTTLRDGTLPGPVADERCAECQLEPVCLPHVVLEAHRVRRFVEEEVLGCG